MKYAIDEKGYVSIGGFGQNLRIRSTDPALPVILFIHGGPGVCDRHWVLKDQSALAQHMTMVCWDQRGAGLSYFRRQPEEDMTLDRMIEDAHEVIRYLKRRFRKKKIYIVGHSWGSLLGSLTAKRYPQDVAAYIGMGQFVDGDENETLSYRFVLDEATKRNDTKALKELERIGWPKKGRYASMDDMMVQRNLMSKYGGEEHGKSDGIIESVVIPILKSPEYSLLDLWRYYQGAFFSLRTLWDEIVACNLNEMIPDIDVPVYLTEGRHDQNCPPSIAEKGFAALDAPRKEWIWFEDSGHSPIKETPEEWRKTVERIVAQEEAICPTAR